MSKLDDLTKLVAESFVKEGAKPEEIEKQAQIQRTIEEAKAEQAELLKTNGELTKAYRDLINSTAGNKKPQDEEFKEKEIPSFEEALKNWGNGYDILGQEKRKEK